MADDTVTLALDGDVSLDDFATAVRSLQQLVHGLAGSVAGEAKIEWVVEHLDSGSAVITVRAESEDVRAVEKVTRAYLEVGHALETHAPIPFSAAVREQASRIAGLIDGGVEIVRFETSRAEAFIRTRPAPLGRLPVPVGRLQSSLGAIEGVIQTLSRRRGLRFTLYDSTYDKAVSCYLEQGQEDLMRNAWGRRAIVEGRVTRDPESGRPLSIRQVAHVELLPDYPPGSYRLARGIIPIRPDDPSAEHAIRRVRDAE